MGLARVHFEGSILFFCRLADRLVQIGSGIYCGFPLLVCYMCGKAATTGLANVSCNREIRRGIRAERCSRARIQAVGVALLMASQAVLAQEPLYDIDIPSLNAAEALNELAEQTGAVMLFPYDLVVIRQANAVVGRFTLTGALDAILEGSGLSGGLSDRRVVQILIEENTVVGQREASIEAPINQGETEMLNSNRTGFWKGLTATLGLAAAAATPGQAQAQVSNVSAVPDLEEIVVTARRREESLIDVPVAITVMNTDFIEQNNVLDTWDLFAETPGVDYLEIGGRINARTTIRGVAPPGQAALSQKSTVFVDGVPIVGSNGSIQFVDLERVEVLRGPQSAAFGRATFAGAINYVTRDPGDEFSGKVQATYSDQNRAILGASFDGPITDTLGFTLDVFEEDFDGPDGWITTDGYKVGATNTRHFSGKLKFTPNDFFDMELTASYTEQDDGKVADYKIPGGGRSCNNVGSGRFAHVRGAWDCPLYTTAYPDGTMPVYHDLTADGFTEGTRDYNLALSLSVLDPTNYRERERIAGEFNFNFDNGSLLQAIVSAATDEALQWTAQSSVLGATTNFRGMFNPMLTSNMGRPSGSDKEDYIDVRWLSPSDSSLRWMVGVSRFEFHYYDSVILQYAGVAYPELGLEDLVNRGMPFLPRRRSDLTTEATGVYGSVAYDINDQTTLSLEGRSQRDDAVTLDVVSGNKVVQVTDSFQPRLAINHALNDDWSIYAQIAQGTNPAGANPQMIDPVVQAATEAAFAAGYIDYTADLYATTNEEELTNYEFGVKGGALDGRLQLAAAVYAIDWQDMLLGERFDFGGTTPVGGSCAGLTDCWNDGTYSNGVIFNQRVTFINGPRLNAGTGDLHGIELEASLRATDNWSFRTTLAMQSSQYEESCDFSAVATYGLTSNCTTAVGVPGFQVGGNDIENNSQVQGTLSATYVASLGGNWRWSGHLAVRHAGDRFLDVINYAYLPAITTATGQIRLNNDNLDIILYGNNLTDEDQPLHARERRIVFPPDLRTWGVQWRLPREIGLRLNYSF